MQAVLKAQINKTDRNDARGIAQMIRVGLYRPVHVKTLRSQKLRMLLTHRKLLQSKAIAIENDLRGTLRNFGLKVGMVGKVRFKACSTFTRVAACTLALPPIRDTLIEGFSHFVTSMTAPIASGWSGCRVGLSPTGKRRLVTAHARSGHSRK
jgi:hypothetical protein